MQYQPNISVIKYMYLNIRTNINKNGLEVYQIRNRILTVKSR